MSRAGRVCIVIAIVITAAALVSSCATGHGADDEKHADRAINLGYIALAVQGLVAYGAPPPDLQGQALVNEAVKDNPDLLSSLNDYFVTARQDGRVSSVLMCDAERQRAIAEDAGCTSARLDGRLWIEQADAPCEFQLDLAAICQGR